MFEILIRQVARILYKSDDTDIWDVLAERDKEVCREIVSAILTCLKQADAQMVRAGDKELAVLIDRLEHADDGESARFDVLKSIFAAMISSADRRDG